MNISSDLYTKLQEHLTNKESVKIPHHTAYELLVFVRNLTVTNPSLLDDMGLHPLQTNSWIVELDKATK